MRSSLLGIAMLIEQRNTNDPHPILQYPLIKLNEKLQQVVAIGLLARSFNFIIFPFPLPKG